MANKWMRKLGLGMSVIMTVSQMSGMMVFAAPESGGDGAGDWGDSAEICEDNEGFTDILEDKFEAEAEEEEWDDTDDEDFYEIEKEELVEESENTEAVGVHRGACGVKDTEDERILCELSDDGVMTITAIGERQMMRDFDAENQPWWPAENIKKIVFEGDIISIGDYAFYGCTNLEEVEFADIESIGDNAFRNCTKLTHIVLPESLESIGDKAFYNDNALEDIYIPATLTSVGSDCFNSDYGLGTMRLMDVYYGGTKDDWDNLVLSGIEEGNKLITAEANEKNKAAKYFNAIPSYPVAENVNIAYSNGVLQLSWDPVYREYQEILISPTNYEVYINNVSGKTLDEQWEICTPSWQWSGSPTTNSLNWTLGDIKAGDVYNIRVRTYFGNNAGYMSSVGSFIIPSETGALSGYCGKDNREDVSWELEEGVLTLTDLADGSYMKSFEEGKAPWDSYKESIKEVVVSGNLYNIGAYAFLGCTELEIVRINGSVAEFEESAFEGCTKLKLVTYPNVDPAHVKVYGAFAFKDCISLESVPITQDLEEIREFCFFNCAALAYPNGLNLQGRVSSIGRAAFWGCNSLTKVVFPANIKTIEGGYVDSPELAERLGLATYYESVEDCYNTIGIGNKLGAFVGCTGLTTIVFKNNNGQGVQNIGAMAFYGCYNLERVDLPFTLETIGEYAFSNCTGMQYVTIADSGVTTLKGTFVRCTDLVDVTIGTWDEDQLEYVTHLEEIGKETFYNCYSLETIRWSTKSECNPITSIGEEAFWHCTQLESIDLPANLESLDNDAFRDCISLSGIILPDGLKSIGNNAFYNDKVLASVYIPATVISIGSTCFNSSTGYMQLMDLYYGGTKDEWDSLVASGICEGNDLITSDLNLQYKANRHYNTDLKYPVVENVTAVYDWEEGEMTIQWDPVQWSLNGRLIDPTYYEVYDNHVEDYTLYDQWDLATPEWRIIGRPTVNRLTWTMDVAEAGDIYNYRVRAYFGDNGAYLSSYTSTIIPNNTGIMTWEFDEETGELRIIAEGNDVEMPDYLDLDGYRAPWYAEREKIKYISFSGDLITIGDNAFRDCTALRSVILPETIQSIGEYAFYNDTAMEDFYIPVSVRHIGEDCISVRDSAGYMQLMDLYYGGTKDEWDSLIASGICEGNDLITSDLNLQYKANRHYNTDLKYPVVENVSAVYDWEEGEMTIQWDPVQWSLNGRLIDPTYYEVYENHVQDYTLDEQWEYTTPTWKVIGKPTVNSLTWTMDEAEAGDIYNYRIRAYFGDDGAYLSSYTSTIIPENVNTLTWDFDEETGELHIIAEGSNVEIKDYIHADGFRAPWYAEREKIKSIRFSGNLVRIGNNAFRDCTSLRNVILPETIQSIGEYAFYNDKALESIYLPKTLQTIGTGCFSCDGMEAAMRLMDLYYGGSESDWASVIIGDYNGLIRTTGDDDNKLTIYYETDPSYPAASNVDTIFEDNTIKISWDEVTRQVSGKNVSPSRYLVYMNHSGQDSIETQWSDGTLEWTLIASTTTNSLSYQIDTPIRDDVYRFRVMEVFGDYHGVMTDYVECKIPSEISVIAAGTCGANLFWTLNDEGVLTISGNGEMDDYEIYASSWYQYKEQISSVLIEKGVTKIGDYAFYGCSNLVNVDISSSVLSIGEYAFVGCESIIDIDIPLSVTRIGRTAFGDCNGLKTFTFPASVTEIEEWTFTNCEGLESIEIPEGVTSIGNHVFWQCHKLTNVKIPSTVTSIGTSAFYGCSKLTDIQLPSDLKTIGDCVFVGCNNLSTVDIPAGVISIGDSVFRNGIIELSGDLTTIHPEIYAHYGAVEGIAIPISVTDIWNDAFKDCNDLTDIYYAGTEKQWKEIRRVNPVGDDWLTGITVHFNSSAPSEEDIANKRAASAVEVEIDAIGTVEYTEACLAKINAARTAYDALNAEQKALVGNYTALTDAEDAYAQLDANNADKKAAATVEETIKAIGTVEYTEESKAKIDAARTAYDKLTETQQKLVSNIATLTAAEEEYTRLKEAAEQDEEKKAISAVEEAITAIGTVEYTEECKAKIDEARTTYDQLTDAQKEQVTNLEVLTAAEEAYAELKAAAEKEVISSVEDAISAIGTVAYTEECKALIDAARTAYDALSDKQKEQVTNLEVLTKAEEEYTKLQAAAGQDAADKEAAAAVVNAIKGIGTVANTDESKSKIDAARAAYDQLTDAQKKLVTNLNVLTDAEYEYARLKSIPAKGTALVENKNGEKVYYKDGKAQTNYSGLAENNGSWYYVEKGVLAENKRGYVDFDGSKFLVVDGKLENTANGLVQDPDHPEDWYFLSGGQAQTQYTGLVQYDGEWFYVNKGGLDTNLAAYVEYDGGLFFVAAGRILTEVNGLAQDPNGGDWYYLANGQVQTQYTGLAQYDGEWFYVQKGRLAVEYITLVDYDGSTFCSVYGMIKDFDSLNETDAVIALCNNERRTRDLPLMEKGEELTAAAQARSGELPESFAHQRPNGESCFAMLDVYGVKYNWAAENIAYGQNTAQIVVEDWMNSDGHRANILNEKCRHIGVGKILAENGRIYWTQMFTD